MSNSNFKFGKFKNKSIICLVKMYPKNKDREEAAFEQLCEPNEVKQVVDDSIKKIKYKRLFKPIISKCYVYEEEPNKTFHTETENQINCLVAIEVRRDEYLASGDEGGLLKLWKIGYESNSDSLTSVLSVNVSGGIRSMTKINYLGEDIIVTGDKSKLIKGWKFGETKIKELFKINVHTDTISALTTMKYLGQVLLVSGSWDLKICLWNLNEMEKPLFTLNGHTDSVSALLSFEDKNKNTVLASGSWDNSIKIWNLEGNSPETATHTMEKHEDSVSCLNLVEFDYINKVSYLCSSSWDKSIIVWDIKNFQKVYHLRNNYESVYSFTSMSFTNKTFITAGDFSGNLQFWSMINFNVPKAIVSGFTPIYSLLTLPNQRLVVAHNKNLDIVKF